MDVAGELIERQVALVRQVRPLFAGQGADVQGAALAELLALWMAGHHPDVRDEMLALQVGAATALVPVMEAELFRVRGGKPEGW